MSNIRILPDNLVSKIAAGEVIERPASVVKELIENSIDAGAKKIDIHLLAGGLRYIRVIDDGEGMSKDDTILSIKRHATSKLYDGNDLFCIKTMGFRGEALSSIASVSETIIITKRKGDLVGTRCRIKGGKCKEVEEVGSPDGTSIEVLDLFYNLPARKKFLRSQGTELGHITDIIYRYAFSHPQISFKLFQDNKLLLNLSGNGDLAKQILYTFGKVAYKKIIRIKSKTRGDYTLDGYISSGEYTLPNRKGIFFYVNSRWVRDRLLNHALFEAMRTILPQKRFPLSIIILNLPPYEVDVNVHPSKIEVRFRDPRKVYNLVKLSVEDSLKGSFPSKSYIEREETLYIKESGVDLNKDNKLLEYYRETHDNEKGIFENYIEKKKVFYRLSIIGHLWSEFLLCEDLDTLFLIDIHAAHERIAFERLRKEYRDKGYLRPEHLLVPQLIKLSPRERTYMEESIDFLRTIGLDVEHFGGEDCAVKSIPFVLKGKDCREWIRDVIYLDDMAKDSLFEASIDSLLMRIACHSVVRGSHHLAEEEIRKLLRDLDDVDFSYVCPHGRPIVKKFHRDEIERFFKRT